MRAMMFLKERDADSNRFIGRDYLQIPGFQLALSLFVFFDGAANDQNFSVTTDNSAVVAALFNGCANLHKSDSPDRWGCFYL
jgi:hypothetical protein